jgi:CRP-like cAMP-binding protein
MSDYKSYPLFSRLADDELASFLADCRETSLAAGDVFIHQGHEGDTIYYVLEGELEVFLETETGDHLELAVLKAPAIVGELEALTGGPREANVRARRPSRLLEMSFEVLRGRFQQGDAATLKVFFYTARVLASRLAAMNRKFAEIQDSPGVRHHELRDFQEKLLNEWTF